MPSAREHGSADPGVVGAALPRLVGGTAQATALPAAGHDGSVPRIFLILFDVVAIMFAFAATSPMAPLIQLWLLPEGPLHLALPSWLVVPGASAAEEFPAIASIAWVLVVAVPTTLLFVELLGGYRQIIDQSRTRVAMTSVLAPLVALGFVTMAMFALKTTGPSRVMIFTFGGTSILCLLLYRSGLRFYKMRRLATGAYARNVILIGQPSAIAWMTDHFRQTVPADRYQLAGWLRAPQSSPAPVGLPVYRTVGAVQEDLPCLADVEDLGAILIHRPVHEVIAVQSAGDRNWLKQVIDDCDYFRVCLRIVPEALLVGAPRDLQLVFRSEPLRLPEVVLAPPHLDSDALFLKRLFDIVASVFLLVALSPLLLLIAIAIKITTPKLPVLYPWRVIGLKGQPFTGYKFTTMVAGAEEQVGALAAQNEMTGPVFKLRVDPRVTTLGRFLRKYSLNELPQLWSVLIGDMSLVGPRPAFRHELDRYQLWHKRKLCVKPGMTCLWQVSGRNRITNFDDWVRLDLEYIDKWSPWLDVRILARTLWAVVAGTGW